MFLVGFISQNKTIMDIAKKPNKMVCFFLPPQLSKKLQTACLTTGEEISPPWLHITVALIQEGNTKKIEDVVRKIARSIKPFSVVIPEIKAFPPSPLNDNKYIVHARVISDDLLILNKMIKGDLKRKGVKCVEKFEFVPHATLKYCCEKPSCYQVQPITVDLDVISFAHGPNKTSFRVG